MTISNQKSQRGIALLIVLIALTILGAMTSDLMENNQVSVAGAVNHRDSVKAEYLARSAVNLSRLMLSVQSMQSLFGGALNFPFWQYADLLLEPFSDDEGGSGMIGDAMGISLDGAEGLGLEKGEEFSVTIVDEDSKINVNVGASLQKQIIDRTIQQLTMLMGPAEYDELFEKTATGEYFEREDVICELLDWADPNEDKCNLSGGEESYYSGIKPEYDRKNAPLDSLQELYLLHGVSDDFWTAFVDPNPEDPEARVMTIWGKGQINVNTAPSQVLFAQVCMLGMDEGGISFCMDPSMRLNLLQILQGVVMIRTFMPFSKVSDFLAAIENPEERLFLPISGFPIGAAKKAARKVMTTQSSVFSIFAEGIVGRSTKKIHVVVDTEGVDMLNPTQAVAASGGKVLYWRME